MLASLIILPVSCHRPESAPSCIVFEQTSYEGPLDCSLRHQHPLEWRCLGGEGGEPGPPVRGDT